MKTILLSIVFSTQLFGQTLEYAFYEDVDQLFSVPCDTTAQAY